jgi:hypothetical protein
MAWVRLVAFCGALVTLPATATAQGTLSPRLRAQGGYTHQEGSPQGGLDYLWLGVTPELSWGFVRPRTVTLLTYTLSALPGEIANRVTLGVSHEVSKTVRVLASAAVFQTSLHNLLISHPAADTELNALPPVDSKFLGVRATEGLSWEASPHVRIGQGLDVAVMTALGSAPTKNYLANASFSADRTWRFDALGIEARTAYATNQVTARLNQKLVTVSLGPRWRHDFSDRLSAFATAGGMLILSPDPGTGVVLSSTARGSLLYTVGTVGLDLSATSGAEPNILTGQILRTDQVRLRASVPISAKHRVFSGTSVGYLRGGPVRVRRANLSGDFQGVLVDADLTWSPTDSVQLFARYQVFDQIADSTPPLSNPSVFSSTAILGIQFFPQPPERTILGSREPQRVDRSDAASPAP